MQLTLHEAAPCRLGSTTSNIVKYTNGLLYGSASLGLDGAVHQGNKHEQLWFGEGCLQWNVSKCLAHTDPLYQVSVAGSATVDWRHLQRAWLVSSYQWWAGTGSLPRCPVAN